MKNVFVLIKESESGVDGFDIFETHEKAYFEMEDLALGLMKMYKHLAIKEQTGDMVEIVDLSTEDHKTVFHLLIEERSIR